MKAGWARRWGPLLAAGAILGALALADAVIKTSPMTGFRPSGAQWTITAHDAGAFCAALSQTPEGEGATKAFDEFIGEFQRKTRIQLGIRPTILRWRVWMGGRMVVASAPEGVGVCLRPGLLLHAVDGCRRLLEGPRNPPFSFAGWRYAWRQGFLILSPSENYVAAVLQDGVAVRHEGRLDALHFRHFGPEEFQASVQAVPGLPVSGSIRARMEHAERPLVLPDSWAKPPILSISVRKPAHLADAARAMAPWIGKACPDEWEKLIADAWDRWDVPSLPEGWEDDIIEISLALTDVVTASVFPLPVLACVMRGANAAAAHPLAAIAENSPAYPAEWNGEPGLRIPWMGSDFTLCLGRAGNDWLAATREPVMAQLAAETREGVPSEADAALRIYWDRAGFLLRQIVQHAPQWKLLNVPPIADVRRLDPVIDFISGLGHAALNAHARNGALAFDGFLTRPVSASGGSTPHEE
ncbi:MAG TPA: hypothetical protein P5318_06805 [Candidatus Hydrogenedentes bacterium]|nr:hypothetical protein [Candidatus Hydrogenedentota bacterium]HRT19823.1 hypothetical protein [Candidatus Hydrogenedentota bacterium]HRT64596.1 hypothetical protein [Candidatus Hydrogenedentota bacterium]